MTPNFAKYIDPIIETIVDFKEQIEKNAAPPPDAIQRRVLQKFEEGEKKLSNRRDEWEMARYQLAVWIDEMLSRSLAWPGADYWSENKLQLRYYPRMEGRERFYILANQAERLPCKDVLEVSFLCVILGFKGAYDAVPGLQKPENLGIGLPASQQDWMRNVRTMIKLDSASLSERRPADLDHPAQPLEGKYQFLAMLLSCVFSVIIALLVAYVWKCQIDNNQTTGRLERGNESSLVLVEQGSALHTMEMMTDRNGLRERPTRSNG